MKFTNSLALVAILTVAIFTSQSAYGQGGIVKVSTFCTNPDITVDKTACIQAAVDSIFSGKVIFDQQYYEVNNTIKLRSYITIEGSGSNTNPMVMTDSQPSSHIRMTGTGKAIFTIGKNSDGTPAAYFTSIAIRDIGLSATTDNGTIGILAEGSLPHGGDHFEFKNIQFQGFHRGIMVKAADRGWQFDNVKLDHCKFIVPQGNRIDPTIVPRDDNSPPELRNIGVYVDSLNSGWQISGIELVLGKTTRGFHFQGLAYSTIDSVIANGVPIPVPGGDPDTQPVANASIYVKDHGSLRISNSVSEGVGYDLKVEGPGLLYPITLESNSFQGRVDISASTVISTGNQFGLEQPWSGDPLGIYQSPLPVAKNGAKVYSVGDKFCFDYYQSLARCRTSGWQMETNSELVYGIGQFGNTIAKPTSIEHAELPETANTPLLSVFSTSTANFQKRPLLRLGQRAGVDQHHYSLSRNSLNGYLEFEGSQPAPYTGYSFNGPIKLPSVTVAGLPGSFGNGTLIFCSDCLPNTTPCVGGGTTAPGALAISVGYNWSCK
ncbi:MAG: hypothetical protein WBD27_15740 [Pyrinomonadaceae bacterium]